MLHSDNPLYCRNHYGRLSHLREKYGKSPPKILLIFTSRQHNFSPNAFFSVHITQHNGNYRMIPFHKYVLCIGILLCWHANDVMFWGYQAHFGTQKNYATGTFRTLFRLNQSHQKCRKTLETLYFLKILTKLLNLK